MVLLCDPIDTVQEAKSLRILRISAFQDIVQLMEDNPMILMYLMAATIFLYSLLFLLVISIGRKVESGKKTTVTKT